MTHTSRDCFSIYTYIYSSDVVHKNMLKKKEKKNLPYYTIYENDGKKKKNRAHDTMMSVLFCQTCITNISTNKLKKMEFRNAPIQPYYYVYIGCFSLMMVWTMTITILLPHNDE
jgi:hypothetical protein